MSYRVRVIWMTILISLFSVLNVGCAETSTPDTSPTYNPETDCQYYNYIAGAAGYLAETADSIYYKENNYLRVIDKKTMRDSILCGKPDCLHDADDDLKSYEEEKAVCNAYVMFASTELCYYKGYLYNSAPAIEFGKDGYSTIRTPTLFRFALDGSSRKNIWELTWPKGDKNDMYYKMFLHRGKFHFLVEAGDGKETFWGDIAYAYDLTTKKVSLLYEFSPDDNLMHRYAIGDHLYFLVSDLKTGRDLRTYRYNMSTKEMETLKNVNQVVPIGDQLLYTCALVSGSDDDVTVDYWMEISDWNGENRREYAIEYLSEEDTMGKQLQVYETNLFITSGLQPTQVEVYDFNTGKLTHLLDIPEFAYNGDRRMSCTRDGKLIVYNQFCLADVQVVEKFYCYIDQIGTPDFQWYEVERIN